MTYPAGTQVVLSRVRHEEWRGKGGVIRKYVKSRGLYVIDVQDGPYRRTYDARPENIDLLATVVMAESPCSCDVHRGMTADRAWSTLA